MPAESLSGNAATSQLGQVFAGFGGLECFGCANFFLFLAADICRRSSSTCRSRSRSTLVGGVAAAVVVPAAASTWPPVSKTDITNCWYNLRNWNDAAVAEGGMCKVLATLLHSLPSTTCQCHPSFVAQQAMMMCNRTTLQDKNQRTAATGNLTRERTAARSNHTMTHTVVPSQLLERQVQIPKVDSNTANLAPKHVACCMVAGGHSVSDRRRDADATEHDLHTSKKPSVENAPSTCARAHERTHMHLRTYPWCRMFGNFRSRSCPNSNNSQTRDSERTSDQSPHTQPRSWSQSHTHARDRDHLRKLTHHVVLRLCGRFGLCFYTNVRRADVVRRWLLQLHLVRRSTYGVSHPTSHTAPDARGQRGLRRFAQKTMAIRRHPRAAK